MKTFPIKITILLLCLIGSMPLYAQNVDSLRAVRKESGFVIPDRAQRIYDVKLVQKEDWTKLFRIKEHPAFDSLLTPEKEREILGRINQRRREHGSDTLLTSDYFYIWRPYFDWLNDIDPHYRIYPVLGMSDKDYKSLKHFHKDKNARRLAFNTLNINDTVIVNQSFDPLFRSGDMIVSINGVTMPEYLKYGYSDRYSDPFRLMHYYYYSFAVGHFDVRLKRDGKEIEIATDGYHVNDLAKSLRVEEYNVSVYEDANKCGYVQIKRFYPYNGRLIKIVHSAIKDFKKRGITNVIIDIRKNRGGSGDKFDELMSIFINEPAVRYMKSKRLMVSGQTINDYDFLTEDMMGSVVDIPVEEIAAEFKTDPKMYVGGMKYYVLMSKDTGSIAASFANILQYNNAAILAGEPLLRNALKYGEVIMGDDILPTLLLPLSISTTEINEHTKAVDGVLMPDIHIPYVANEYLSGRDAVLESLINIIGEANSP